MARRTIALLLLISCVVTIAVADNGDEKATKEPEKTEPSEPVPHTDEPAPPEEEPQPPSRILCEDPREVYNECGNACDHRTCETIRRNDLQCTKQCVEGCFCRNGYVRDDQDRCIPAYRCGKGF